MNPIHPRRVVVVGAGHGGANVAALLRQQGFAGEICLLGDEPGPPYQRPPLSKDYLKGAIGDTELLIKPEDFYAAQRVETRWGVTVTSLDTSGRTVVLDDGTRVDYDALVLATGAAPRALPAPGADLPGVHYLRSHDDARSLGASLQRGRRLVVIGGGYVGLEVAASASHLGCAVTVLEREERALARVASQQLASFLSTQHAAHGTTVLTGADVGALLPDARGSVAAVELADGTRIPCDVVLVGVGAVPRTALADAAGISCDQGVLVDLAGQTSADAVFAIGDVTRRPLHHFEGGHRLESIPSAVEQAKCVVAHLLGAPTPRPEVPWFWSDQYHLKIKIAGLVAAGTRSVVRGDPATGRFSVFHLAGDRVVAAETVNSSPDFMVAKRLIDQGVPVTADRIGDLAVTLKELAA
ncbi:MAG: ferredoxin reductase [Nocardioides sp.]|jgi:3-phenylpropionate/trans-cinnamate dioxygenase ferredoxin reductase subunit|nr:ferredoxin reductase [Nocardioides sp.]